MDLLSAYNDSSDDETNDSNNSISNSNNNSTINTALNNNTTTTTTSNILSTFKPNLTPTVTSIRVLENKINPNDKVLKYNPTIEAMAGDIEGPKKPFSSIETNLDKSKKNHTNGYIEDYHINDYLFNQQIYQYRHHGIAENPNDSRVLITSKDNSNNSNNNSNNNKEKRKRTNEDPSDINNYKGPWAAKEAEIELKSQRENEMLSVEVDLTEKQKQFMDARVKKQKGKSSGEEEVQATPAVTSIWHGKDKKDYMGRSWLEPSSDLRLVIKDSFIPKKLIHTWTGHTKSVAAIRFTPKYGNLLLSAGMDNTIKIWDVYNDRRCLQTYTGHNAAVRDICFSNDSRRFLSCGYDRQIRLWDTETGQIISSFNNGKIPYCIKFNPDEDKQNEFLSGGSDKKILQWDIKSNEIVQEYDQHLGAVNTITFVDDNRRFVSSSDDKSLRIWDWGIPVVIKYISDPTMHSMPAVALHPKGKWFAAQSLDNQILVYGARDKFRMNKKKRFLGHNVSGYACEVGFSPDGKYIYSGDATGKAFFWDWKTSKIVKTLNAHDGVCIGIQWCPLESSKVVTAGWDGKIKMWD